jgi:arylsulfatase A-like enzyme
MTPSKTNHSAKSIPHSYNESLWPEDPWYDIKRDMVTQVLKSRKSQPVKELEQRTTVVQRDVDVEHMKQAKDFPKRSTDQGKPFFLYFNYSMMHLPTTPRAEFEGKSGNGEWADALLQMETDFGTLLDYLISPFPSGTHDPNPAL